MKRCVKANLFHTTRAPSSRGRLYSASHRSAAIAAVMVAALVAPIATHAADVSHVGRWFTDEAGRVLIFHGAVIRDITALDLVTDPASLESVGFNSVKINPGWLEIEPEPGVYDGEYLGKLR